VTSPGSFTTEDYAARMSRAAQAAAGAGLTGLLVTPGPDLRYFAGYTAMAVSERITMLAIQAGRQPAMIVPAIERADAQAAPGAQALSISVWSDGQDPYQETAALLEPGGRYAISDSAWAMHLLGLQRQLPDSSFASMTAALPMLRAIKDADELELLASGAAALDAVFGDLLRMRFSGRREMDVASDLADLLREHGHSEVEFTLVGSGPNGANPHHQVSGREIEEGDMVVLDFGGIKGGYASDITRTVHVGEPCAEEREVYDVVARAYTAGLEAVRPGAACQEVDRAARRLIADAGYGEQFIHRAGHGIGLMGHEPPYMVEGETIALEPGMCFSIEPGVYLAGRFGVRIEDIVAVTEDGGRSFNSTGHELQIVS
jgi:Xaa-Pro aminopeptidase